MRKPWATWAALGALALVAVLLSGAALMRGRSAPVEAAPATAVQVTEQSSRPTPTPTPIPARRTMVVIGDGYTRDATWPDKVGTKLNMQVVNLAESGMGYRATPSSCSVQPCTPISGAVNRIKDAEPDVVVIAAGETDGDYPLASTIQSTLTDLDKAVPDAKIIVMSPFSSRTTRPTWLVRHAQDAKTAAESLDATWVDTTGPAGSASAYENGDLSEEANTEIAALVVDEIE